MPNNTTPEELRNLFFFNDQYDDRLVKNMLMYHKRMNFYQCIDEERTRNDYLVYEIKMNEFQVNHRFNEEHKLPKDTLSYYFNYSTLQMNRVTDVYEKESTTIDNFNIIPYYNKKKFIDVFGFNRFITMEDMMIRADIFRHTILCQIDDMFFFGLKFLESTNGCYLIIEKNKNSGIGDFENLKKCVCQANKEPEDMVMRLYYQNHDEVFHTYRAKHLIFKSMDDDYAYLDMDIFSEITKINKYNMKNKWVLYVSFIMDEKNLMVAIPAVDIEESFLHNIRISRKAADFVLSAVANCNCYLINQYSQVNFHIFDINDLSDDNHLKDIAVISPSYIPVANQKDLLLQLSCMRVPIQKIRIFEYNNELGIIGGLVADTINQHVYNGNFINDVEHLGYIEFFNTDKNFEYNGYIVTIPDITKCRYSTFYMEWFESVDAFCNYDFGNKELVKFYGENYLPLSYTDFHDTPEEDRKFLHYTLPPMREYDFETFREDPQYPDLRDFRVDLLKEVLHEMIDRHKTVSYDFFKKNTVSIRKVYREKDNPNIFSRCVRDTSDEITDINHLLTFREDMMYIRANLSEYIKPSAIIFVNGIRVNTEAVYADRKMCFFYFKRSHLKDTRDNVVEIEIFLYDTTPDHKLDKNITFYSTGVSTVIPDAVEWDRMSVKNLMLYDKRTMNYISPEEISFRYKLGVVELNHPDDESGREFIFDPDDLDFFMTHQHEFFIDDNQTFLMVRKESILYDCPKSNKKLNMENVYIKIATSHRTNHLLGITNTNNYRKIYLDDGLKSATVTMKNFKELADKNRFRVYYGGKLLADNDYTMTIPQKYDDDVTVSINNISTLDNNREIILEYLPIEETLYCDGIPNSEKWVNDYSDTYISVAGDCLVHIDDHFPVVPEMLKVYLEGYRVPYDEIRALPGGNYFFIKGLTPGKRLTIYINAHDDYPYEADTAINTIGYALEHDTDFREHMKKKYDFKV